MKRIMRLYSRTGAQCLDVTKEKKEYAIRRTYGPVLFKSKKTDEYRMRTLMSFIDLLINDYKWSERL